VVGGVAEDRMAAQARELCEQLPLVLEPTLASKLKGDFKSGKRINLKKREADQPQEEGSGSTSKRGKRINLKKREANQPQEEESGGKRINLKKIIPFISSQFKRDKIWMHRTAPVNRTYQVPRV
jgi:midasin (ATPase involved in ribosome maturation)